MRAVSLAAEIIDDAIAAVDREEPRVLVFEFEAGRGPAGFKEARAGAVVEWVELTADEIVESEGLELHLLGDPFEVQTSWNADTLLPQGAWDAVAEDPAGEIGLERFPGRPTWGEWLAVAACGAVNQELAHIESGASAPGVVAVLPVFVGDDGLRTLALLALAVDGTQASRLGLDAGRPSAPGPAAGGSEPSMTPPGDAAIRAVIEAAIRERLPEIDTGFGAREPYVVAVPIAAPGTPDGGDAGAGRVGGVRAESLETWGRMRAAGEGLEFFDWSMVIDPPRGAHRWMTEDAWDARATGPSLWDGPAGLPDGVTRGELLVVEACRAINAGLELDDAPQGGLVAVLPISLTGDEGDEDVARAALNGTQRRVLGL